MLSIDLNADLGEYATDAQKQCEVAILAHVTSCSIACGGHAGTPQSMREVLQRAADVGVCPGAHPAYPDPANFGRKSMNISASELRDSLQMQIATLADIADELGIQLTHIKPHGALYNDAMKQDEIAETVLLASAVVLTGRPVLGLPDSVLEKKARDMAVPFVAEGFVDRRYTDAGHLQSRMLEGAVFDDPEMCAEQAVRLGRDGIVVTASGNLLHVPARTLCLHGDSPGAVEIARKVAEALGSAGISLKPFAYVS